MLQTLFFFLKIVWVIQGPLWFYLNYRIIFYFCKNAIGVMLWIH